MPQVRGVHSETEVDEEDGVVAVWGRLKETYQRVWERRGYERETSVLILKSALAATLALAVGMPLDPSGSFVGFAPFSALLIVQPSVYGAVQQSWRYVAAVVAGALFAGAGGLTVGLETWSFALAVLAALVLGQVRLFGGQGKQVPVVAAFALANGSAESPMDLGQLLLMVGVGALSALLTNLVMAPAIRFKDAESAVLDFADDMGSIATGLTEELRGDVDESNIDYWTRRSESLDGIADNAWDAVERQESRVRLNPRRLLSPQRMTTRLTGYRTWILALERASRDLDSITQGLQNLYGGRYDHIALGGDFQHAYADLLEEAASILQGIHDEQELERRAISKELGHRLDEALANVSENRRRLMTDPGDEEPARAALLTDLTRLLDELNRAREHSG